ncbi:MAG: OPT/YSL family transporter, partial [Acidobacteria bacterium]|nr:OPT/YSL family transporter [Acidobacteriota bacterium]
ATLMATCAMFLAAGWTAGAFSALALSVGGVVCIAAANAGATSQDLKTGYLVGATPVRQQVGLMIGVMASVFIIGLTLILMNVGLAKYQPVQIKLDLAQVQAGKLEGVKVESDAYEHAGKTYVRVNAIGSRWSPDGKYLYDKDTQQIEIQWETGIGGAQAAAPQARLMATVINGILTQRLPWRLVLLGVFLVIAIELLGIRSLSFAVGSYLSIATTLAIFTGGVVRWLVERGTKKAGGAHEESEVSPGSLYASGLIAAGGVIGLLAIVINLLQDKEITRQLPGWLTSTLGLPLNDKLFDLGARFPGNPYTAEPWSGVVMFLLLAVSLFFFARKKLD